MSAAFLRKKVPWSFHVMSQISLKPILLYQEYNPTKHSLQFTAFKAEPLSNTSRTVSQRGGKGQNKEHCLKRPFNTDNHLKPISLKTKRLHSTWDISNFISLTASEVFYILIAP